MSDDDETAFADETADDVLEEAWERGLDFDEVCRVLLDGCNLGRVEQ